MPYLKRAGSLDLTGYECKCCGWTVLADMAVYYDADQDIDGKPVAAVWCQACRQAIDQERMQTWLQAANMARHAGQDRLAAIYMAKVQLVALSMEAAA